MRGRDSHPPVEQTLAPVVGSVDFRAAAGRHIFRSFITGDTVMNDDLEEIPERYLDIDLALLHLGAPEPSAPC